MTKVKVVGHDGDHSKRRAEVELQIDAEPEIAAEQFSVRSVHDALKKRFQVVEVYVDGKKV